ncbi:MAG: hypothetical protein KDD41_01425 [Flavobacteriales bacterium]|nr:hypothetical protein [Flavobacteriales bacterium]
MKRIKLLLTVLITLPFCLSAQKSDKKIDELVFLFVDGKYDKLVYKAQSAMEDDDLRRHPLPYIYCSMAYYEMSKLPGKYSVGEKESEFPNPLKDAQKYLYKFIQKDSKAQKYYETNWYDDFKEYYINIADTSNKMAQFLFLNEKYSKAASVYKAAARGVPADPVLKLWLGINYIKAKNTNEGKLALIEAMKEIDEKFVPSKATSAVLPHGLQLAEELLRSNELYTEADKAKKLVEVFKKYDPDELDKKKMEERQAKAKEAAKDDRVMRQFYSDEDDEDNKDRKGNVIIKDGYGSNGNGTENKDADSKLDEIEKEAEDDGNDN